MNARRLLLLLGLMLLLLSVTVYVDIRCYLDNPANRGIRSYEVDIAHGMTVREVSSLLMRQGIVRHASNFALMCRAMGRTIPSGRYTIPPGLSPTELLSAFNARNLVQERVTIPEGSTLEDIAETLEASFGIKRSDFLSVCTDAEFIARLGIQADTLEGYLYPDTYHFEPGTSARKIARRMTEEFFKVCKARLGEWESNDEMTLHSLVTLASLLEKETAAPDEKPLISAVIHNRLKKRMYLQIDPTVIYGIADFDGNLTRRDLKADTPYNTYTRKGLPPGPICSPSAESLVAAARPADVDYLYFVSMNNGRHKFSQTIKEHTSAVRRYQKSRRSTKRSSQ